MNYISAFCEGKIVIVNFNCFDDRFATNMNNTYLFFDTLFDGDIELDLIEQKEFELEVEKLGYLLRKQLGYNKGDGQALHNAIGEAIDGKLPNSVEQTKFGQKYTFNTKIRGKDGSYKSANVVVVVQNDNGKVTWRTITLYPGKKD